MPEITDAELDEWEEQGSLEATSPQGIWPTRLECLRRQERLIAAYRERGVEIKRLQAALAQHEMLKTQIRPPDA